jgi:hypothetical protein
MFDGLRCSADGKFKILCFGDLHECDDFESEDGRKRTEDYLRLANAALNEYEPDLCVFMGDIVCDSRTREKAEAAIRRVLRPVTDRGIPFTVVFGNHEHDLGMEDELVSIYSSLPGFMGLNDDDGVSGWLNHNLLVYSSDGKKPVFNLWFIDSNNLCDDRLLSVYGWVKHDQIRWYEKKAEELRRLNGGRVVPAVLFQHIPVDEEYRCMRRAKPWELYRSVKGFDKHSRHRYVAGETMTGYLGEGPCSPGFNEGQFDSWKRTGDVIGAFFGHDHLNDFTCEYDGVTMGQCKTAAFRCYTDGCRSCVRMITLDENEPGRLETEVKHFKEYGLKCESLGPIFRTLTDRQSIACHTAFRAALGVAAAAGAALAVRYLRRR